MTRAQPKLTPAESAIVRALVNAITRELRDEREPIPAKPKPKRSEAGR